MDTNAQQPSATTAAAAAGEQVRVQFHTHQQDVQLPSDPGPILVSTGLKRYALSTLINTLLETSSTAPIPFSFLINGRFLSASLGEYLTEQGQSAESVLEIEYVRAALPPTPQASFEHDDWVSSVDVLSASSPAGHAAASSSSVEERILSASYDGIVRVWDTAGTVVAQSTPVDSDMPSHLLSARFLSANAIASAGFDGKIHIHEYDTSNPILAKKLTLLGHRHIVTSLDAHCKSQRILSASSDNTAMLWATTPDSSLPPVPASLPAHITSSESTSSSKRRKQSGAQAGPLLTLRKHTRPVAAAIFAPNDATVGYTAGADRQLLTWDLTTGTAVSARIPVAHEPLTCLAAFGADSGPGGGSRLLVSGTGTGSVMVVDVREAAPRAVVAQGRAHRHGVTGVDIAPSTGGGSGGGSAGYGFATSARGGGELFVWDVRNVAAGLVVADAGLTATGPAATSLRPTFRVERHHARPRHEREGWRVLSVRWDARVGLVSGGEDRRVQVDRSGGGGGGLTSAEVMS